jgi:hypothetical protein
MNPPAIHVQSTKNRRSTPAIHSIHRVHAAPRTYVREHLAGTLRKRVLPRVCITPRGYRGLVDYRGKSVFGVDCPWTVGGFSGGVDK